MGRFESGMESMIDTYMYETTTLIEQLDQILIKTESSGKFDEEDINEIFRIMHTIKGSSAMMGLENIASLSHSIEDMFFIIREEKPALNSAEKLFDLVFSASDLLKAEVDVLQDDNVSPSDFSSQIAKIEEYAAELKKVPEQAAESGSGGQAEKLNGGTAEKSEAGLTTVRVFFEDGIEMEHLRALLLVNNIKDECGYISYEPEDIETNPETAKDIIKNGFRISFKPVSNDEMVFKLIEASGSIKTYEIISGAKVGVQPEPETTVKSPAHQASQNVKPEINLNNHEGDSGWQNTSVKSINEQISGTNAAAPQVQHPAGSKGKQSLISVNLNKLDQLLDMVGEIVITEAMVISNPDLKGLRLDNFQKAARQLRKLTDELQDIVMSIRMVPISGAFNKMTRIVRDMKVKLNKDVDLIFEGEDTEVDKSVIDSLFDPLMHMVRNSMDHGIENNAEDRLALGKPAKGTVTLSAYNSSNEVIIVISDDGAGIDCEKVLEKAAMNGLLMKPESEYTDKEIFNLIMLPGFSTNEEVTEYSGRGVGMDVVRKNIEKIGGSISIDSKAGIGTDFIIKIPLSLAIVDGIEASVGSSIFTIPMSSIKESIKLKENQLVRDTAGREMVMLRGECHPLIRLHEIYGLEAVTTDPYEGIVIVVEAEGKKACLLVDKLIGEQQVVVKPFSPLLNRYDVKRNGMAGCTILGDGSITIILDVNNIIFDK